MHEDQLRTPHKTPLKETGPQIWTAKSTHKRVASIHVSSPHHATLRKLDESVRKCMSRMTLEIFNHRQFRPGYKHEGDCEMYTEDNISKRCELKYHPHIQKAIQTFWHILDMKKDRNGSLGQQQYIQLHKKIQRVSVHILCTVSLIFGATRHL